VIRNSKEYEHVSRLLNSFQIYTIKPRNLKKYKLKNLEILVKNVGFTTPGIYSTDNPKMKKKNRK